MAQGTVNADTRSAVVALPGQGVVFDYYATSFEQVLAASSTDGALTMMRVAVKPHSAPPLHFHTREDEFWVVLSGQVRFWFGADTLEECATQDAGPGSVVFGPRHIPHTFDTITETSEVLIASTPGALEQYFQEIGPSAERRDSDNGDVLASYGVKVVGPAPDLHAI